MARSSILISVYLPTSLLALGQGLLLATLPLYASDFDVSYRLVSFVVAAAAIGTLVTDVPAGAALSKLGLRPAMIGGAALVATTTLALAWTSSLPQMIVLRLIAGIGTALWGLSRHAYIAEAVPVAERGRTISIFGGINRIGVFGGPAIGGLIADSLGLKASFVLAGIAATSALVVSITWLRPVPTRGIAHSPRGRWSIVGHLIRLNGRDLAAASVAQTFGQMIRAGRFFIIPIYGADVIGLDVAEIGLVMTVASLVDVAMFFPAGILMDRFGRKVAAVPSFAVMGIGVGLIPLTHEFLTLMGAAVVIGFGNGLGSGTMMTLGADLAPPGATGEFLGIWRLIGDSGAVAGPLIVGAMASEFGLRQSALSLAVIGIAAAFTLAFLVRETRATPVDSFA